VVFETIDGIPNPVLIRQLLMMGCVVQTRRLRMRAQVANRYARRIGRNDLALNGLLTASQARTGWL